MTIEQLYNRECNTITDINEHLYVLKTASEQFKHITEFGVRTGASTTAFLAGKPTKLISYDISKHSNVNILEDMAKEENIDFTFQTGDTRKITIEPTEVLFIDTLHTYEQLKIELYLHHDKVSKHIIMHDTNTFGWKDMEDVYKIPYDNPNIPITTNTVGLQAAITEFLQDHPQWYKKHELTNNNGLVILGRGNQHA